MSKEMLFPKTLKRGDTVGLVAPASPMGIDSVGECRRAVEDLGYRVVTGESVYKNHLGYLSGDDEVRAGDINRMFADKGVDGIFCLRGGYGCGRIADMLDMGLIAANPKVFVGYSDISVLHLVLNQRCKMITFHGPMVGSDMIPAWDDYSKGSFLNTLDMDVVMEFENPRDKKIGTLCPGVGRGILTGGNLSLLVSSIGTSYELDTRGKILFIEDIGEATYRVDRLLQQLKHAQKFEELRGIILGDFIECHPKHSDHATLMEVFEDILAPLEIPTVYDVKVGHGSITGTLPLGTICEVDAGNCGIKFFR